MKRFDKTMTFDAAYLKRLWNENIVIYYHAYRWFWHNIRFNPNVWDSAEFKCVWSRRPLFSKYASAVWSIFRRLQFESVRTLYWFQFWVKHTFTLWIFQPLHLWSAVQRGFWFWAGDTLILLDIILAIVSLLHCREWFLDLVVLGY